MPVVQTARSEVFGALCRKMLTYSVKIFQPTKADLKNAKKASRSSSMEEQIFDVSILTKSCSYKKEKVQKYKLFAALIGTHGKTDWKEINANLQGEYNDLLKYQFENMLIDLFSLSLCGISNDFRI